jgi:hypothetical protein
VAEQSKAAFTLSIFSAKSHATVTEAVLALATLGTDNPNRVTSPRQDGTLLLFGRKLRQCKCTLTQNFTKTTIKNTLLSVVSELERLLMQTFSFTLD